MPSGLESLLSNPRRLRQFASTPGQYSAALDYASQGSPARVGRRPTSRASQAKEDEPNTLETGEVIERVSLPDGSLVKPATPSGRLVKAPGKSNLYLDPTTGEPYNADPSQPTGLRSAWQTATKKARDGKLYASISGVGEREIGPDPKVAEDAAKAAAKREAENRRLALAREKRPYNIDRVTGEPVPLQSDEEWAAAKQAKAAKLEEAARVKRLKDQADVIDLEADRISLTAPKPAKEDEEAFSAAESALSQFAAGQDMEEVATKYAGAPATDEASQQAKAAAENYLAYKDKVKPAKEAEKKVQELKLRALDIKEQIINPQKWKEGKTASLAALPDDDLVAEVKAQADIINDTEAEAVGTLDFITKGRNKIVEEINAFQEERRIQSEQGMTAEEIEALDTQQTRLEQTLAEYDEHNGEAKAESDAALKAAADRRDVLAVAGTELEGRAAKQAEAAATAKAKAETLAKAKPLYEGWAKGLYSDDWRTEEETPRLAQEAAKAGLDVEQAKEALQTYRQLDWSNPRRDAQTAKPISEAARLLPNGEVTVNPSNLLDPEAYDAAVDAMDTTPEAKARAKAMRADLAVPVAEEAYNNLRKNSDFAAWLDENTTGTPLERMEKFNAEMKEGGALNASLMKFFGSAAGLPSGWLGTVAGLTGSDKALEYARFWQDRAQAYSTAAGEAGKGTNMAGRFIASVAGGLPSVMESMAAGGVARRVLGSGAVALGVAATDAMAQSGGNTYVEAVDAYLQQGLSPEEAKAKAAAPAIASGLVTGVLTALGGGGVESLLRTEGRELAKSAIKRGLKSIVAREVVEGTSEEALEEWSDQLLQGVIAQVSYNPNKPMEQVLAEAVEAGLVGGVLGGGVSGIRAYGDAKNGEASPPPEGEAPAMPVQPRPAGPAPTPAPATPQDVTEQIAKFNPTGATPLPKAVVDTAKSTGRPVADVARQAASGAIKIAQGAKLEDLDAREREALGFINKDGKIVAAPKTTPLVEIHKGELVIRNEVAEWLTDEAQEGLAGMVQLTEAERRAQIDAEEAAAKAPAAKKKAGQAKPATAESKSQVSGAATTGGSLPSTAGSSPAPATTPTPEPAQAGPEEASTPPASPARSPSPNLPPRSNKQVPARPPRNGRDTAARDKWDEEHGDMRKGGRTHNNDGSPYQPTVYDETVAKVVPALKDATFEESLEAIGSDKGAELGSSIEKLLNDGWVWDPESNKMVDPQNRGETPIEAIQRIDGISRASATPAPAQASQKEASPAKAVEDMTPEERRADEKAIQKKLLQASLETDDKDAAFAAAGYTQVDGFWVHSHVDPDFIKGLKPETKKRLKEGGVIFFDSETENSARAISFNDGTRGIGVKTDRKIGADAFTLKDTTVLHELGHHIWQNELTTDQKVDFGSGGIRTEHGREVASGAGRGETYKGRDGIYRDGMVAEEDFAQHFAENNGDLAATLAPPSPAPAVLPTGLSPAQEARATPEQKARAAKKAGKAKAPAVEAGPEPAQTQARPQGGQTKEAGVSNIAPGEGSISPATATSLPQEPDQASQKEAGQPAPAAKPPEQMTPEEVVELEYKRQIKPLTPVEYEQKFPKPKDSASRLTWANDRKRYLWQLAAANINIPNEWVRDMPSQEFVLAAGYVKQGNEWVRRKTGMPPWKGVMAENSAIMEYPRVQEWLQKKRENAEIYAASSHSDQVNSAVWEGDSKPSVNAAAVDAYGIKLPDGYTREGDLYVYRPAPSPAPASQPAGQAKSKPAQPPRPATPEGRAEAAIKEYIIKATKEKVSAPDEAAANLAARKLELATRLNKRLKTMSGAVDFDVYKPELSEKKGELSIEVSAGRRSGILFVNPEKLINRLAKDYPNTNEARAVMDKWILHEFVHLGALAKMNASKIEGLYNSLTPEAKEASRKLYFKGAKDKDTGKELQFTDNFQAAHEWFAQQVEALMRGEIANSADIKGISDPTLRESMMALLRDFVAQLREIADLVQGKNAKLAAEIRAEAEAVAKLAADMAAKAGLEIQAGPEAAPQAEAKQPEMTPEKRQEQAQTIRDMMATNRENKKPIPQGWVNRLAELEGAPKAQEGEIYANIIEGHPQHEVTHSDLQYLIPIKIKKASDLDSKFERAQALLDKWNKQIGVLEYQAKNAKTPALRKKAATDLAKLSREKDARDILRDTIIPELERLYKEAESRAPSAPAQPAPQAEPAQASQAPVAGMPMGQAAAAATITKGQAEEVLKDSTLKDRPIKTYEMAVAANQVHMGTKISDWSAFPFTGEAQDGRPTQNLAGASEMQKAPTLFPNSNAQEHGNCEWCGKQPVKNFYFIKDDGKKWTLAVGSECITHFADKSGDEMAGEARQSLALATIQGITEARKTLSKEFSEIQPAGYGRTERVWRSPPARTLNDEAPDILGKITIESGAAAHSRWLNTKLKAAREWLARYAELMARPETKKRQIEWRSRRIKEIETTLKLKNKPEWELASLEKKLEELRGEKAAMEGTTATPPPAVPTAAEEAPALPASVTPAQAVAVAEEAAMPEPAKQAAPFDAAAAKGQKKFLLAEVAAAVRAAPKRADMTKEQKDTINDLEAQAARNWDNLSKEQREAYKGEHAATKAIAERLIGYVTIEVPGDGTFTILNEKEALYRFQKKADKFPTTQAKDDLPAKPTAQAPTAVPALKKAKTTADVVAAMFPMVSTDTTRGTILQKVKGDGTYLWATDGRVMVRVEQENGGGKGAENVIYDEKGNAQPVPADERNPAMEQVIPDDKAFTPYTLDTARWFSLLSQARAVIKDLPGDGDSGIKSVSLYRNPDGSLGLFASDINRGDYAHNIQPEAQILAAYSPDYFQTILRVARNLGNEQIELRIGKDIDPATLRAGKALFVLMPMRLNADTAPKATKPAAPPPPTQAEPETPRPRIVGPHAITMNDVSDAYKLTDTEIDTAAAPVVDALKALATDITRLDKAGFPIRGGSVYTEAISGSKFTPAQLAAARIYAQRNNASSAIVDAIESAQGDWAARPAPPVTAEASPAAPEAAKADPQGNEEIQLLNLTPAQERILAQLPKAEAAEALKKGLGYDRPQTATHRLPNDPWVYMDRQGEKRLGYIDQDGKPHMLTVEESAEKRQDIARFEAEQKQRMESRMNVLREDARIQDEKRIFQVTPSGPAYYRKGGKWYERGTDRQLGRKKEDGLALQTLEGPNAALYEVKVVSEGGTMYYQNLRQPTPAAEPPSLAEQIRQAAGAGFTETSLPKAKPAFRVRTLKGGERVIEQFEGKAKGWKRQIALRGEEMDDAWIQKWVESRNGFLMPTDEPAEPPAQPGQEAAQPAQAPAPEGPGGAVQPEDKPPVGGRDEPAPPAITAPGVRYNDIPLELARRAHMWTSFVPDVRARGEQRQYVSYMNGVWAALEKEADTDEKKAQAKEQFEIYRARYVEKNKDLLRSHAGLLSAMITGPAKFPVAKAEKRTNAYNNKLKDFIAWDKKAKNAMLGKVNPQASGIISADDANAPEQIQARIDELKARQEMMKKGNTLIKKNAGDKLAMAQALRGIGVPESEIKSVLFPPQGYGLGWQHFTLTNNNANIRRNEERLERMQSLRARPTLQATFEGGRVKENTEANRVQIFFDAKPPADMIAKLKANGFKWAPSQSAWQRQRTPNAVRAAESVLGVKMAPPAVEAAPAAEEEADFGPATPTPLAADEGQPAGLGLPPGVQPTDVKAKNGRLIIKGQDVGMFEFTDKGDIVEIDRLYIDKDQQKKGYGRAALRYLFDRFPNTNFIEAYPLTDAPWIRMGATSSTKDGAFLIPRPASLALPPSPEKVNTAVEAVKNSTSTTQAETILNGLSVDELKQVAKATNYPATGSKKDLVRRLLNAVSFRAGARAIMGDAKVPNAPLIERTPEQQRAFQEKLRQEGEAADAAQAAAPKRANLDRSQESFNRSMAAISLALPPAGQAVTPAQDAEHLAAVEAGDLAKAQSMVDEAAKAAAIEPDDSKVSLSQYKWAYLKGLSHRGTDTYWSFHTPSLTQAYNSGRAQRYKSWDGWKPEKIVSGWRHGNLPYGGVSRNYAENIAEPGLSLMALVGGERTPTLAAVSNRKVVYAYGWLLPETGSDNEPTIWPSGISNLDQGDIPKATHDPVAYDESGEVIPLSERFNPASPSILRNPPAPEGGPAASQEASQPEADEEADPNLAAFMAEQQAIAEEEAAAREALRNDPDAIDAMQASGKMSGRNLSKQFEYPEARAVYQALTAARDELGGPETVQLDKLRKWAKETFESDPEKYVQWAADMAEESKLLDVDEQAVLGQAFQFLTREARLTGDKNIRALLNKVGNYYLDTGTRLAQAMSARRDPLESPQERWTKALDIVFGPSSAVRRKLRILPTQAGKARRIASLEAELAEARGSRRADVEAALKTARAQETKEELLEKDDAKSEKIKKAVLKNMGVTEDDLMLSGTDRHALQSAILDLPAVKEGLDAYKGKDNDGYNIMRLAFRGFSDEHIANDLNLNQDDVGKFIHDATAAIIRPAVAAQVKAGTGFGGLIKAGFAKLKKAVGLGLPPKAIEDQPSLIKGTRQTIDDVTAEVNRVMAYALQSAKARNSGKLMSKVVMTPSGQRVRVFVPFDPDDAANYYAFAREYTAAKASAFDKVYEYWINWPLLSGPQTQVANITGNAAQVAWHYTGQRLAEATLNLAYQDPNAPQFREFKHILKGFWQGIGPAFEMARETFLTEGDTIRHKYLGQPLEIDVVDGDLDKVGNIRASVGGQAGRISRLPGRVLRWTDAFFKTAIMYAEASAVAYRRAHVEAKRQGLKGQARAAFIDTEIANTLNDTSSAVWGEVMKTAEELLFQDENMATEIVDTVLGGYKGIRDLEKLLAEAEAKGDSELAAKLQKRIRSRKFVGSLMRWIFPFQRTPTNIVRAGIKKAGGSAISLLYGLTRAGWLAMGKDGVPMIKSYPKAMQIKDASETLLAGLGWLALASMLEGDDNDDEKPVLLVGTRSHSLKERAATDQFLRKYGGENSIVWQDGKGKVLNSLPFGRYEPAATLLTTWIDAYRNYQEVKRLKSQGENASYSTYMLSSLVSSLEDKSFLQGFANAMQFVRDVEEKRENPDQNAGIKMLMNNVIPNLIKQPLRNMDDVLRERTTAGPGYAALPNPTIAPKLPVFAAQPKISTTGENLVKSNLGFKPLRVLFPANVQVTPQPDNLVYRANQLHPTKRWSPQPLQRDDYNADPPGKAKPVPITDPAKKRQFAELYGRLYAQEVTAVIAKLGPTDKANPPASLIEAAKDARARAGKKARAVAHAMGLHKTTATP